MKYFITGGTGFLGAYITRDLVQAGCSVTVFDLNPNREFLDELMGHGAAQRVEVIQGDVTELDALLKHIGSIRPDRIIHLASTLESSSNENPLRTLRVNCEGTLNIFESALKAGVKKVVWASSIAVFGFDRHSVPGPIANDAYHQPGNLYGACKSLNEQFSKFYNQQGDINCVGLRYSAIYGYGKALTVARGTGADFLEQLIDKPALGEKGIVPYGDVVLDWLYVEDASRATIAAANTESYASSGFNICGSRHSMGEVAAEVRKIIPDAVIDVQPGTPFDGVFDTCFDMSTTADAINYMPQISLQEGLQKNISMLRNT